MPNRYYYAIYLGQQAKAIGFENVSQVLNIDIGKAKGIGKGHSLRKQARFLYHFSSTHNTSVFYVLCGMIVDQKTGLYKLSCFFIYLFVFFFLVCLFVLKENERKNNLARL